MDATDRKLLALLADNAETAYRDLGERLGLSAPSVFERVKKLKAQGVIKQNTIAIDGEAIGRPLLAFVLDRGNPCRGRRHLPCYQSSL